MKRRIGHQCYRCQEFGHIAHECTKPKKPQQQEKAACSETTDAGERKRALQGMSFGELRKYFKPQKDWRMKTKWAPFLLSQNWTLQFASWNIGFLF